MKKRIVVEMMATVLVMGLLAGCAKKEETKTVTTKGNSISFHDGVDVSGTGAKLTEEGVQITEGGEYTLTGESENANIYLDTEEDVTLKLNGVNLSSEKGPVIYGKNSKSITIETVKGTTNTLTDGDSYETDEDGKSIGKAPISSKDDLIFTGEGTLILQGNYKHGIDGSDSITFKSGTYEISTKSKDGVHANDDITIEGGTFTLNTEDDGFSAGTKLAINNGDITVHTNAGDAFDSNGEFEINGGNIVAYGGSMPEGALDCDQGQVKINGGTIIAVGDANSEISTDSKQVVVLLGQYETGNKVTITSEDGTEVMNFTIVSAKSNIVISSSKFEEGKTYKVLVNGEEQQSFTVDSKVVSAGGSAQSMGGPGRGDMGGENKKQFDREQGERPELLEGMELPQGQKSEMGQQPPQNGEKPIVESN